MSSGLLFDFGFCFPISMSYLRLTPDDPGKIGCTVYMYFSPSPLKVDNNVTRHLDKVLKRGDWDVLILHYLGLDHIGHISGPNSPLIGHKLSEMDSVLMKIHTSLLSKVSLTVMRCLEFCVASIS